MEVLFDEPVNVDIDENRAKPGTKREVLNMQLTSNGGNSYSLEASDGFTVFFTLADTYQPCGGRSFPNKFVIFSCPRIPIGGKSNGEIGTVTIDLNSLAGTYVPLYNHQELDFQDVKTIECDTYSENDKTERVYWTDRITPMKAFNTANPLFTTYFPSAVPTVLTVGKRYMVLRGIVTDGISPTTYGPNQISGTVFTAVGTGLYFDVTGGAIPPLVIEYVPIETLDATPKQALGEANFVQWISGQLGHGKWSITFQEETDEGALNGWAVPSFPIHITQEIPGGNTGSGNGGYQAYQGHPSTPTGSSNAKTTKGIRWRVDNIDTNFTRIRLAAIYIPAFDVPQNPVVFIDTLITGSTMEFDLTGGEDLQELLPEDIQQQILNLLKVGTLAINQNYLFIGKVQSSVDFNYDPSDVATISVIDYLLPSDMTGYPTAGDPASTVGLVGHKAASSNVVSGDLLFDSWYEVVAGSIRYPSGGTLYNAGSHFQCTSALGRNYNITSSSATVRACLRIQRYGGVYKFIPLVDDWYDAKGMAVDMYLQSAWRKERYRMGLMLYDTIGNPLFVRFLGDKSTPSQHDVNDPDTGNPLSFNPRLTERYGAAGQVNIRNLGFRVDGLDFGGLLNALGITTFAELKNYFSGVSIVRVPLERTIVAQGILHPTAIRAFPPNSGTPFSGFAEVVPIATPAPYYDDSFAFIGRFPTVYNFFSPDFLLRFNNLPNAQSGDYLEIQDYLDDNNNSGVDVGTLETTNYHYYHKFFDSVNPNANAAAKGDKSFIDVDKSKALEFGDDQIDFGVAGFKWGKKTITAGYATGGARESQSGRTYLVTLKTPENPANAYSSGNNYPLGFGEFNFRIGIPVVGGEYVTFRPLVNWVRPIGSLYGGTNAAAKASNSYMGVGHYQPFDDAFLNYLTANFGFANGIEFFGGGAYVSLYDNARMLKDDGSGNIQISLGQIFCCESATNPNLREGRHLARDRSKDGTTNPTGITVGGGSPQLEEYIYNPAYSTERFNQIYPALPVGIKFNSKDNHIVRNSLLKIDGERIDNLRRFLPNNFKRIDGKGGDITNLRAKAGKLYYWQQDGIGYLPVNERVSIGSPLGDPMTIGTGGVIPRYDEIQTTWGNRHQFSLCETEDAFHWYDVKRKSWCIADVSGQTMELSTVKGIRVLMRNIFGTLLNVDQPASGVGINSVYDMDQKMVLMTFNGFTSNKNGRVGGGMTLSYDTLGKKFNGTFSFVPGMMFEFFNRVISFNHNSVQAIIGLTSYAVGDFVVQSNNVYVCIVPFLTGTIPLQPSLDTTHWKSVHKYSDVFIHNKGDVCKFYGVVYPSRIIFVLNMIGEDGNKIPLVWDNVELLGNNVFFDKLQYNTSDQQAVDLDVINSGNTEFEYRNKGWLFSIPLADDGRLIDYHLKVLWERTNLGSGTDITVSDNKKIKIVSADFSARKAY